MELRRRQRKALHAARRKRKRGSLCLESIASLLWFSSRDTAAVTVADPDSAGDLERPQPWRLTARPRMHSELSSDLLWPFLSTLFHGEIVRGNKCLWLVQVRKLLWAGESLG